MFKLQRLKKPISALMATSLLIMSAPAFSASGQSGTCPTCPQRPTALEGQKIMEHEATLKTQSGSTIVIPSGTAVRLQGVGDAPTGVGCNFRGRTTCPVEINGVTVLPTGSEVQGEVTAVNIGTNTMQLDLQNVSLPSGEKIPLRGQANISRTGSTVVTPTGQFQAVQTGQYQTVQTSQGTQMVNVGGNQLVANTPYTGGVQVNAAGMGLGMPYLSFGRCPMTPGKKILAGTLGGAVFGGAVGALSGMTMAGVYGDDIAYSEGTGAARGALWGSIMGAGLGLVTGLIAAAADRDDACVTSTCPVPVTNACMETPVACPAPCPVTAAPACPAEPCVYTNLTTGSLEERTVSFPSQNTQTIVQPAGEYNLILDGPVTIIRR